MARLAFRSVWVEGERRMGEMSVECIVRIVWHIATIFMYRYFRRGDIQIVSNSNYYNAILLSFPNALISRI